MVITAASSDETTAAPLVAIRTDGRWRAIGTDVAVASGTWLLAQCGVVTTAYFERLGENRFRATEHTSGAWRTTEQHIAPSLGLLIHLVERDRDRRRDDQLFPARLCYDILGVVPVGPVETRVRVLRPGRTVEVVEAALSHDGRDALLLRAWLLQRHPTGDLSASPLPRIPGPEAMAPWEPTAVWPGGFVASVEVRRDQAEPGDARYWARTATALLADEPMSDLARIGGLLDLANGMTVRADPRQVAFPNVDLTAHLFTQPRGEWLGFDTTVTFGDRGAGLTHSVLHDVDGPIGTSSQALVVRPG